MSSFTELKRRNVFKVAVAYAIVAWLLVQVASIIAPALHLPDWTLTLIVFLTIIGFPLALFLAWAYELTPEGIKPTQSVEPSNRHTHLTGQKLNYTIIGLMALVIIFLVIDNYVLKGTPQIAQQSPSTVGQMPGSVPVKVKERETTVPPNSIAVLPFVNMSEDKTNEYFADGVAEEILNTLARIKELEVRGHTSSFYFKGRNEELHTISKMLNVKYILEGSVRKAGDQVRITVEMINTQKDKHLWSKTYDRTLKDIFVIQEDIAKSVADTLEITLGVGELGREEGMTRNVEAYDAYLAGHSLMGQESRENVSQAIEQYKKAVALDPNFAIAWDELGETYGNAAFLYMTEKATEYSKKEEAADTRAIALAPNSPFSLFSAANEHYFRHEWVAAEQSFKKALVQIPEDSWKNSLYGLYLLAFGRPGEAIGYYQRAVRSEPLYIGPASGLGLAYEYSGDLDAALKQYEHARKLVVGDTSQVDSQILGLAMTMHDRTLIEAQLKKTSNTTLPLENHLINPTMGSLLDKPEQAQSTLQRFYADPAYNHNVLALIAIGMWAAYFDDQALALKAYQDASKSPTFPIVVIWRPLLKGIRPLPGFKDIVRNWNLVDYWRETGNWGVFCHPVGENDFECK